MSNILETPRAHEIAKALDDQRARIAEACREAGRPAGSVQLLPVTKFFPASDARILRLLGCAELGESRAQEAGPKAEELALAEPGAPIAWHMIGRLQRNKASNVVRWAAVVQSVDNEKLARALSRAAATALDARERDTVLRVCLQVSLDGDPSRGGARIEDLPRLGEIVAALPGLELAGLMAVPPLGSDTEQEFARLRQVHDRFVATFPFATTLSAGMSADAPIAIRHGSTCVRVGTALLGPRPITSP
ncbi:YggS family pyridoxal phosphate-dependent enzyme [Lolliginicoccus suaedae]|uniref:YggS family pyridoxal phosphate-dependent enzyme n=1 Tax=Lolliginicoccus suaedae TaxID=2605429 RepID=UPI0011EE1386|nr:YggS family pyridoxal phosphate-dependent enzyme [Lolliginicoccus suaedae]